MKTNAKFHFILISVLVYITVISAVSYSQIYWIRQTSPTTNHLYRCVFTDTLNGWAAGDSGVVIHTSNAGNTWVLQRTGISYAITDLFFVNSSTGWGIANDFYYQGTTILYTSNAGTNWIYSRFPDTSLVFNTVFFTDAVHGLLGGYEGALARTTNSGLNWSTYKLDTTDFFSHFPIRKFYFIDPQNGLACGGIMDIAGLIWKTTNSGLNWQVRDTVPEPLYDVKYLNGQKTFATGGDFEYGSSLCSSVNSGVDWHYNAVGYFGQGMAIAFRTASEIWVPLGFSTRWMVSYDTGNNWTEIFSNDTNAVYDARFVDSLHGWAFGFNGGIYKFNTSLIGVPPNESGVPLQAVLNQNYPNPFNPSTTISFELSKNARVRIVLYDILGREVKVILDGMRKEGSNKIFFDAGDLSSGVYFYELSTGTQNITRKMVILK